MLFSHKIITVFSLIFVFSLNSPLLADQPLSASASESASATPLNDPLGNSFGGPDAGSAYGVDVGENVGSYGNPGDPGMAYSQSAADDAERRKGPLGGSPNPNNPVYNAVTGNPSIIQGGGYPNPSNGPDAGAGLSQVEQDQLEGRNLKDFTKASANNPNLIQRINNNGNQQNIAAQAQQQQILRQQQQNLQRLQEMFKNQNTQ